MNALFMPSSLSSSQSNTSSSTQMAVTAKVEASPGLPGRRLGALYSGIQVVLEAMSTLPRSSNLLESESEMLITMAVSTTWVSSALPFPLSFFPLPRPFPFLFPPEPWLPGFGCCGFCWLLVWLPDGLLPGFPVSFQQFSVTCEEPRQILQRIEGLAFLIVWPFEEEAGAMWLAREVLCRFDSARIIGISLADVKSVVLMVWMAVVTRLA